MISVEMTLNMMFCNILCNTRGFQVSLPPEVRKKLKLRIGDYLAFVEENGKIMISKVTV